jgi:transposase InsO family protein
MRRAASQHHNAGSEGSSPMTRDELAAAIGIADLDAFVLACLQMLAGAHAAVQQPVDRLSIEDVAARLNVSSRWLADECRAGRVEHVYLARKRFFTESQVQRLLEVHTVVPPAERRRDRVLRSARMSLTQR